MKIILKKGIKGMIYMGKRVIWIIGIILIIILGIWLGIYFYDKKEVVQENSISNNTILQVDDNTNQLDMTNTIQINQQEEKTTPNTLIIYKTYYTQCNHYINEYSDIDISAVNLTEDEIKEKNLEWEIEEFSKEQIILKREKEEFCNQHFKLKMVDDKVVIYTLDQNDNEIEYRRTDITAEYLTQEDVLNLKQGILVYGKENLTSVLEDYE